MTTNNNIKIHSPNGITDSINELSDYLLKQSLSKPKSNKVSPFISFFKTGNSSTHSSTSNSSESRPQVQMLNPPVFWDWPVSVLGSTGSTEYSFCDKMTSDPTKPYYSESASSFSENYKNLVEYFFNAEKFEPRQYLAANQIKVKDPQGPATLSSDVPDGWTKVVVGGIPRFRLSYEVSMTPDTFLANISTESCPNFSTGDQHLTVSNDGNSISKKGSMTWSAQAISQVNISPGIWYDQSILAFAKNPSVLVSSVSPEFFFGVPNGTLVTRVAQIIVAYKPKTTVVLAENTDAFDSLDNITIAGIEFDKKKDHIQVQKTDNSTTISTSSNSSKPFIMGVVLQWN